MTVTHHEKHDLLYICLDDRPKQVTNLRVDEDIVLDTSKRVDLDRFLTVDCHRAA